MRIIQAIAKITTAVRHSISRPTATSRETPEQETPHYRAQKKAYVAARALRPPKAATILALLALTVNWPTDLLAQEFDFSALMAATHEQTLENGLKIIVREDKRAPIVVFQVWYWVGGSDDTHHITGISHVLEHMMFKGTHALGTGKFSEWVSELGGSENAFTSRDHTVYYQAWTKKNLPLSIALEADRMTNLILPSDEFDKEIKVVMEERRMRTEDNPNAKLYERFARTAYTASPYGQPIIGWMHDLETLTLEDIRRWYKAWYAPNNATVVVVGDVDAKEVFELVAKAFGQKEPSAVPKRLQAREITPLGERRITVKAPAKLPTLLMGFNVPTITTAEDPTESHALYMLAGILDGGYSARLSTNLVRRDQIAAGANAGYSPISRGDSLFLFSATPSKDVSINALEQAIWSEIKSIQEAPPSQDELARVQAQTIASLIYDQDSLSGQANSIGSWESAGLSWKDFPDLIKSLNEVTPQDVQAAAKKYLIKDRVTVGTLDPQPIDPASSARRPSTPMRH